MQSRFLKALIGGVAVLSMAGPVHAADSTGKFAVRGIGSTSCAQFKDALTARTNLAAYVQWVLGYVSATNRSSAQTFDILPTQQGSDMLGVLAAVCRAQPGLAIEAATFQAIKALSPLRVVNESPLVTISNGTSSVQVRSDSMLILQNALVRKKFFKGPATGQPGSEVSKAIKAFQEKEGLAATGLPDIDTFVRAVIKP